MEDKDDTVEKLRDQIKRLGEEVSTLRGLSN